MGESRPTKLCGTRLTAVYEYQWANGDRILEHRLQWGLEHHGDDPYNYGEWYPLHSLELHAQFIMVNVEPHSTGFSPRSQIPHVKTYAS